jgi:hypothetical protein
MNLKRRIEGLEERLEPRDEPFAFEDAISREVISRMSTEELREYRDVLKRLIEIGKPAEEDAAIWHHWQQLYVPRRRVFSETCMRPRATLCVRTGAQGRRWAPRRVTDHTPCYTIG